MSLISGKITVAAGTFLASLCSFAAIANYDRTGCRLGHWTEDYDKAFEVAQANNTIVIAAFVKNNGSCGVCNSVAQSLFETDAFKNEAARLKIPLLLADYTGNTYASRMIDCNQYQSFPVIAFLDKNGNRLAWTYASNVPTGNGTAAATPKPSKGFMISSIKSEAWEIAQRLIAFQNNAPYAKTVTGGNKHRNAAALEIVPDDKEKDTPELKVHTLWEIGWTNRLCSRHWMNGNVLWAFYEDQFDWWKFENKVPGTSYEIKTPVLSDPGNLGMVCVFTNRETAVSAWLNENGKAVADSGKYDAAVSNAYWTCKMSDLDHEGVFNVPYADEVYILFTRRNVTSYEEDITLDYTFTLQEVNKTAYSFEKEKQYCVEDVGSLNIPVTRSSSVGNGKVTVAIEEAGVEGYAEAVEGVDFVIENKTLGFANGVSTNDLVVVIARGEEGIESPRRAFKIVLQSDNEPETGWRSTTVFIEDKDVEVEIPPELCATAKNIENTITAKLNLGNVSDEYYLTNVTEEAGSIYTFAVDPVDFRDFAAGRIKVRLMRDDKVIQPEAGAEMDSDGYAWVTKDNYVFYLFGSDSGSGSDVKIEVAREAGAAGERPNVLYKMTWWRFDRPVVSVAGGDREYASGDLPATAEFTLQADSITAISGLHTEFKLPVRWSTSDPEAGDAAVKGDDYEAVSDAECTIVSNDVTVSTASISVEAKRLDKLSYPTRSFVVGLDAPGKDALYVLGAHTNATVTLLADDVKKSQDVSIAAPVAGGDWVSTGDDVRRLNYTNTVDWIAVTNVAEHTFYRLQAQAVLIKPTVTELTVDVCTNRADDAKALFSTNLRELVFDDLAKAPLLYFDELGADSNVWLRVSREQDDSVLAEYKLLLREWEKPTFRFAETSVETNDTVAKFNLTLLREGNVSDEVTVKVVSSNETAVADGDYFSVPETVTFAANSAEATLQVTITDPEWNAHAWTGDRTFSLSLSEVYPVNAFDFSETSNKTTVVLMETSGYGLDEADGFDETRDDVTTNDVAVAIASDGALTNLVRTLNGCAAEGYVNDMNDWFRFSGIETSETYCFKAIDCLVSNAEVKAEFYIGDSAEATKSLTLEELKEGWRYTAETNADVFVRIYRDQSDKVAAVNYTLVAYKYIWPVVGFSTDSIVATNTDLKGGVPIEVFRRFNTNETVSVNFFAEGRADGWERNVFDCLSLEALDLPPAEECTTNVSLIVRGADADVWVGDWSCNVYLSADADKVRFGDYTNVTVTVVDNRVQQKDATDPVDDTEDGAVVAPLADDGSLSVTNHLNGIDVAHYGVVGYSDTNDWMRITGVVAENTYLLSLANVVTVNDDGLDLVVEVRAGEVTNLVSFAEMDESGVLVPCPTADDILVRIGRSTCTSEVPVSVKYELNAERIDWPSFTISAVADSVGNDAGTAALVVIRADNIDATNMVVMTLVDTNDVKVISGESECTLVFEPGVACVTQEVAIVGAEDGFWKRGGEFSAALTRTTDDPYVTIGVPSNVVVTVVDASGILENDYPADDTKDGAQVYEFSKDPSVATNYYAAGQSPSALGSNWLNGSDTVDWYRFDGTASNKTYRFSISGVSAVNAEGLGTSVTVYDADMTERGVTNLVNLAKWDFKAVDANGFYVCVSREACATNDVSIRYALSFREMASVYAEFVVDSIEVSEAADAVYVDVVCRTGEGELLEQDAVVTVTPVEDETAAYPAGENEDFDPTPVVVTWPAGTVGGVKTVKIPLANYDGVWEGTETFLLELEPVSDIEIGKPDVMTVTIVDKDPPTYGTVGITGYGETTVREGDVFPVEFTRIGGDAGAVTGKFSWVVGKAKTEQTVVLFEDREGGAKTLELDVPKNEAFALSQSATLTFALVAAKNTVALTKGSPTKVALTVMAANYGGKVADYADGDATKPAFRAADTAWYAGSSGGTLVAATPKTGGTSVMSVPLTGPCTITFDAVFSNAANCRLLVKDGSTALATLTETTVGAKVVVEAYGTKTIQFVFERGKTGTSDTASVEISNISVVRSDDANRIGTYTGVAEIGGVPGFATMTVAANGKLSAKFACADRTWTVSGKNPWLDDVFTAKSGGATMPVAFALDAAAGTVEVTSGDAVIATLSRNCWGDKPLSAAAAAALEKFVGYYTVALAPEDGGTYGSGYLGVTVAKNGSVKASGVLADGQSVSISSTLVLGDGGNATVPLFAKPLSYNGGWICDTLVLSSSGEGVPSAVASVQEAQWTRFAKGGAAQFARTPCLVGGWYDKTENLYEAYTAGLTATVENRSALLSFGETGSKLSVDDYDGMFTVSFTRATGLFSGYVREYVEIAGRSIRKSYHYRGMLTPNAADGSAAGRGFFLRGADSVDVVIEGR